MWSPHNQISVLIQRPLKRHHEMSDNVCNESHALSLSICVLFSVHFVGLSLKRTRRSVGCASEAYQTPHENGRLKINGLRGMGEGIIRLSDVSRPSIAGDGRSPVTR